jgi:hypothetical protein
VVTAAGDAVVHERDEIRLVHLQLSDEDDGDKVTEGRVVTAAGEPPFMNVTRSDLSIFSFPMIPSMK